jgi:glycosyltransferase involved in cell wall biosynthesis
MKISVVIPTYKRPALLLRCVSALMQQDFSKNDFEIIVVSDGFDDHSEEILMPFFNRPAPSLHYFPLPKKAGPAAARNIGWQFACSELIAFTDDDCIPDTHWLSSLWNAYQRLNQKYVAFSGRTVVPLPSASPTDYERNIAQLEKAEFITANCACTKAALEKVGGLDEQFTMAWREDSDLQFKFIAASIPVLKVKDAFVTHPVRKAPWGISIKEEKKGIFNALLYKKYPHLYRTKIQRSPPWHYYIIVFFIIMFIIALVNKSLWLAGICSIGWLSVTTWFTIKRLSSTSHSLKHIVEMFFTSAVIPLLSLYYRFYGAWKYRVLLIP